VTFPTASPEQTAWDSLTRLEENLRAQQAAQDSVDQAESANKRAEALLNAFHGARDKVLNRLYDDVRDRFVELYRALHGEDEASFVANLNPDGAGLALKVEFYGRGMHPPQALHSEGHQDSMGLCLYLSLAERLMGSMIDLLILDDVVMSVDASHRRQVCRVLREFFPAKQFVITTHDKTWANQLKSEGVVPSRGLVEFYNWNVESGPQVNHETDLWSQIERDLQNEDVPAAAARLRRGGEEFFGMVCDGLGAVVPYKLNSRWGLGDFLPAAIQQYRNLLKHSKVSANSWGDREEVERLKELESTSSQVFQRSKAEQWAINASVHYNNWATFTRSDFRPIVEAFHDLWGIFTCHSCGSVFYVVKKDLVPQGVKCACGKVSWNLIERGKSGITAVSTP
jgi:hypothetical protein